MNGQEREERRRDGKGEEKKGGKEAGRSGEKWGWGWLQWLARAVTWGPKSRVLPRAVSSVLQPCPGPKMELPGALCGNKNQS